MPADQEDECAGHFSHLSFALSTSRIGWGGGERGAGEFYSQRRHFLVCILMGYEFERAVQCFISTFACLVLTCLVGKAGKAVTGLFALSDGAFGMHVSGSESERAGSYFLASFPRLFLWAGWREKRGASGLYS